MIGSSIKGNIIAIRKGVFFKELKGILVFRLMQYYGTYQGHNQKGKITKELKSKFYYPSISRKKDKSDEKILKREQYIIKY